MPELPEVRTVAESLDQNIQQLKIVKVTNYTPKMIWKNDENWFLNSIIFQSINKVDSYGKYLIFSLDDYKMISHLRMEGKWTVSAYDIFFYPKSHLRIEFELSNNKVLRYFDSRKFGTLELWKNDEYLTASGLNNLGPEPLNGKPSTEYLLNLAKNKKIKVKPFLLDQKVVCGIGNIYVNEILFAAKIAPDRNTNTLSKNEIEKIIVESNKILEKAIELKGSSIHSYRSGEKQQGQYQNELKVHLRENKPCEICKKPILKTKIGGRGTYFCAHCQK